jgi:hypothetical protein
VAIRDGNALESSTRKSLYTIHFPSSGHQTWYRTRKFSTPQRPLVTEFTRCKDVFDLKKSRVFVVAISHGIALEESINTFGQVAVSLGPHLRGIDGLVDLDDLASYKAVLLVLAEAARLRFT